MNKYLKLKTDELLTVSNITSIGKFLSNSTWHEDYVERVLQKYVTNTIWDSSKKTGYPIYVIIDDTISERTMPSSKAIKEFLVPMGQKGTCANKLGFSLVRWVGKQPINF